MLFCTKKIITCNSRVFLRMAYFRNTRLDCDVLLGILSESIKEAIILICIAEFVKLIYSN